MAKNGPLRAGLNGLLGHYVQVSKMNLLQKMIKNDEKYPFLGHYVQVLGHYVQVFLSHKKWLNHAGLRVYGTLAQNFLQTNCDKKINKYKRFIKSIKKCPNLHVKQIFDKPFIFTLLRKNGGN